MRNEITLDAFFLFGNLISQFKDFLLNFCDELVLGAGIWCSLYIQDLQFGFDADHFLVLRGFLMFLLVLDLSDVVLDFSDDGFELSVFLYWIFKFGGKFQDGLFQELESELSLALQQNVKNSSNSDLHLLTADWDEFIIFGGESLLDSVKGQEWIGLKKPAVQRIARMRLDEQLIVLLFKCKAQKSLLLLSDIILFAFHVTCKYSQLTSIKITRSISRRRLIYWINAKNKSFFYD